MFAWLTGIGLAGIVVLTFLWNSRSVLGYLARLPMPHCVGVWLAKRVINSSHRVCPAEKLCTPPETFCPNVRLRNAIQAALLQAHVGAVNVLHAVFSSGKTLAWHDALSGVQANVIVLTPSSYRKEFNAKLYPWLESQYNISIPPSLQYHELFNKGTIIVLDQIENLYNEHYDQPGLINSLLCDLGEEANKYPRQFTFLVVVKDPERYQQILKYNGDTKIRGLFFDEHNNSLTTGFQWTAAELLAVLQRYVTLYPVELGPHHAALIEQINSNTISTVGRLVQCVRCYTPAYISR